MKNRCFIHLHLISCMLILSLALIGVTRRVSANEPIIVNNPSDEPDANPDDGLCISSPSGVCTLRAAIQTANARPGSDTIFLQENTTYLLTRAGDDDTALNGDLDILESLTLTGAGFDRTIIDGNGNVTLDRAFHIKGASVTVTITGVTLQRGKATLGAGLRNEKSTLKLTNSAIVSNTGIVGSGVYNEGTLTIDNSVVKGNIANSLNAQNEGGGIMNSGTLTINDSTISHNAADGVGFGGGIFQRYGGVLTLNRSTVSDNTATYQGGGIYIQRGTLTVINSTISTNRVRADGGGIWNNAQGTIKLYNATIAQNWVDVDTDGAGAGGGIYNDGGVVALKHTIIAGNHKGLVFSALDDCHGELSPQNWYNLIQTTTGCTVNGSYFSGNPKLGSLQDNGGPTKTHALLSGSPAIDAGDTFGCRDHQDNLLSTDQRGLTRHVDGKATGTARCDLGAYEFGAVAPTPTPTLTPIPSPTSTPVPAPGGYQLYLPVVLK